MALLFRTHPAETFKQRNWLREVLIKRVFDTRCFVFVLSRAVHCQMQTDMRCIYISFNLYCG